MRDQTDRLRDGEPFPSFGATPAPDDVLLIGLSSAVPACAVLLHFECETEGVGVDPRNPPWIWEAWDGDGWTRCTLESDGTGGFNRGGDVVVHVPRTHTASVIGRHRAGWIRCRVLEANEGQPTYGASPRIHAAAASTIGGTTAAVHGEIVTDEVLGESEGVPGQTFTLRRHPVVAMGGALRLQVSTEDGWDEWAPVEHFALSGPEDKHFLVNEMTGQVEFGPAVREPDGGLRQYGAVPAKGSELRIPTYRIGGGRAGNVARGALSVLKSSIPYVSRVENRTAAAGGVDGEDIDNAKIRGPILLRTRDRCVTIEDYQREAREAAPEVVRVQCVPAGQGVDAGAVRVLVVPSAPEDELGRIVFDRLLPEEATLERIATYLDERRVVGTRVMVEPPAYQGITIVASLRVRTLANAYRVQTDALRALYSHFHPVRGGADGRGWPFGRPVHVGEVYAVLQRLPGVELVEDVRLFLADPRTGTRGDAAQRIDMDSHTLVFSYEHQIRVEGT